MAKRTNVPARPVPEPVEDLLIEAAQLVIGEYFFDPDKEDQYKALLSSAKIAGEDRALLDELSLLIGEQPASISLEALKSWTAFRVTVTAASFVASVEGTWSFSREELSRTTCQIRRGNPDDVIAGLEEVIDGLTESDVDMDLDDRDMDLDDVDGAEAEDDDLDPIPELPEITAQDRNRVKLIAKRISRMREISLAPEDDAWLQQNPQVLPEIVENLVAALRLPAEKRDAAMVVGWRILLALQLEYVRYRLERGWDWAKRLAEEFQQRLVTLGEEKTLAQDDWIVLASALADARIPVSEDMQSRLADAGLTDEALGSPEDMMATLRDMLDSMASMISTPFEVVESLQQSGAMLPGHLRSFIATELALSPHRVLAEAVPLMLLDPDSDVRRDAAHALEQTARSGGLSPDSLRRMIAMRNWLPPNDRAAADSAIRTARLAGLEPGSWPASTPGIEFHVSIIDGSGAQSILLVNRTGRKGLFGGILLRHGEGVKEVWIDDEVSRGRASKMLKEANETGSFTRMEQDYVDRIVQNAIATGVAADKAPPGGLMQIAERLGGPDWQDRRIDVAAEALRLFEALPPGDRTPDGLATLHQQARQLMTGDPLFASWFEEGPEVGKALRRGNRTARMERVMREILPPRRDLWAERFLLMALWSIASNEQSFRAWASPLAVVAHALASGQAMETIPAMEVIADQTLTAGSSW